MVVVVVVCTRPKGGHGAKTGRKGHCLEHSDPEVGRWGEVDAGVVPPPGGGLSEVGWCCSQLSRRFGRCAARPARLSACCLALAVRRRRAPVGLAGVDS